MLSFTIFKPAETNQCVRQTKSESISDELLKVEIALLVAQALELRCQLSNLQVCDAHFCEDLLDALQSNHIRSIILLR